MKTFAEISVEKRSKATDALLADPNRPNETISKDIGVSEATVQRMRKMLEATGNIPVVVNRNGSQHSRVYISPEGVRANEELLKDPRRSDRLIAALVGVVNDTVRLKRQVLEKAGLIPVIPASERVNSLGKIGRGTHTGGKIEVEDGQSFMELAAKGLEIEAANQTMKVEDVALLVGINMRSYRYVRTAYLLLNRDDLNAADKKTIRDTIAKMEAMKQVTPFWPAIQPIADRIWGKALASQANRKEESKRKKQFDHSIGLITDMCSRGPEVEVPHLTEKEQLEALHRINDAIGSLKLLSVNIRRARG